MPAHTLWPGALHAHLLAAQICAAPHTVPQLPQFMGSVATVLHAAPHAIVGAEHELAHTPALQNRPLAQTLPHAPQFCGSEATLTQPVAHAV